MTSRCAFAVPVLVSALATCCQSAPTRSSSVIADARPAVVMVVAGTMRDGEFVPSSRGSGTIMDSGGHVLTNHHLLFDAKNGQLHDTFMIGLFHAGHQPDLICMGSPSEALSDAQFDLSLIRCDRDRDGEPWRPNSWPTITSRETDVAVGEPVWVLGYPATGEMSIRAGVVSGVADGFIQTSVAIAHGHSGGAAIDQKGKLIGVSSGFRRRSLLVGKNSTTIGRIGLVRPIHAAVDLISDIEQHKHR